MSWDDDGSLLWSRSDRPGVRRWEGAEPATTAAALDAVIAHVGTVRIASRQPGLTGGFALVEVGP